MVENAKFLVTTLIIDISELNDLKLGSEQGFYELQQQIFLSRRSYEEG